MARTLLAPGAVAETVTARGWTVGSMIARAVDVRVGQGRLTGPVRVYTDSPNLREAVDVALTEAGWVTQEVPGLITGFTVVGHLDDPAPQLDQH